MRETGQSFLYKPAVVKLVRDDEKLLRDNIKTVTLREVTLLTFVSHMIKSLTCPLKYMF